MTQPPAGDATPNGVTGEMRVAGDRVTGDQRLVRENAQSGEFRTIRQTPLGSSTTRGGKTIGLRLYGVASLESAGSTTPLAAETELVAFRDMGAVVAPAPYNASAVSPHDLEHYAAIVGDVAARHSVLPAPPGTVFRSREALLNWLELHYFTLAEALDYVADRTVARVTVRRGDPHDAATATTPAVTAAPATLRLTLDDGETPLVSDLVSLAADALRDLRREAVALIVLRAGPEAASPDDTAHGSFLIERTRWDAFVEAVAVQGRRHASLRLECSGPWPAYDFVHMQFTT